MPIEISVTAAPAASGRQGGAGSASTRIWIDQAHTTATIAVTAEPTAVDLDPRVWVTMMQGTLKKQ
jgi:hypothetical protein